MLRITNSGLAHCATAALLMLALAGPALASHDEDGWDDDGRSRGYPVHRHGESCDRDYDRGQHGRGYGYGYGGGRHGGHYDGGGRYDERATYGCRPCGRRYDSRSRFYRHLSHQHHVAPHWAPRVLVHVGWGWLFRG